jgi:hypothetical protein
MPYRPTCGPADACRRTPRRGAAHGPAPAPERPAVAVPDVAGPKTIGADPGGAAGAAGVRPLTRASRRAPARTASNDSRISSSGASSKMNTSFEPRASSGQRGSTTGGMEHVVHAVQHDGQRLVGQRDDGLRAQQAIAEHPPQVLEPRLQPHPVERRLGGQAQRAHALAVGVRVGSRVVRRLEAQPAPHARLQVGQGAGQHLVGRGAPRHHRRDRGDPVERAQPRLEPGERVGLQVGLRHQQPVGERDLLAGLGMPVELARGVHRVDRGHHAGERAEVRHQRVVQQHLHHRRRVGEPGGLDDDAPERRDVAGVAAREQLSDRALEVRTQRAAHASALQHHHLALDGVDQQVVQPDRAELVDDHRGVAELGLLEQVVEQRRLPAAQEARQDRDRRALAGTVGVEQAHVVVSRARNPKGLGCVGPSARIDRDRVRA